MINQRWLVAIPIVLAAALISPPARASSIRDRAHMFSPEAVKKAESHLDRLERATRIPIVIETLEALPDGGSAAEKKRAIDALAVKRDKAIRDEGIYLLISKSDHLISHVLVRQRLADLLPIEKRDAIRDTFIDAFKKRDFDAGLSNGVQAIERALEGASVGQHAAQALGGYPWVHELGEGSPPWERSCSSYWASSGYFWY